MKKIVVPKSIGGLGSGVVVDRVENEYLRDAVDRYGLDLYFKHIMNPHSTAGLIPNDTLGVFCGDVRLPGVGEVIERICVGFPYAEIVLPVDHMEDGGPDYSNVVCALDYGPFTFGANFERVIEFYAVIVDEELREHISAHKTNDKDIQIGRYYVNLNILVVSDLTHCRSTINVLGKIVDELKTRGYVVAKYVKEEPVDKKRSTITVTVGCDPEFEYLGADGSVMSNIPNSFVTRDHDGYVEETGIDGSGVVAEIRPSPAVGPKELVDNIYDLFERVKGHKLSVVGNRHAIGCHLHFGVGCSWSAHKDLVDMLDQFVGIPCIGLNGSARGDYGCLSGAREQPHGFEYRTLPAGITADPEFFRIVVKICKIIVQKYVNGKTMEYDVIQYRVGDIAYLDGQRARKVISAPARESYKSVCGLNNDEISYFWRYLDRYHEIPMERLKNVIACWIDNSDGGVGVGWSEGGVLDVRSMPSREWLPDDNDIPEPCEEIRPPQVDFHVALAPDVECCVHLCEDWTEEVRRDVTENFESCVIQELISRGITDFSSILGTFISMSLIGLRSNRGLVVHGFDPPVRSVGSLMTQHTRVTCLDNTSGDTYGLSRWFRDSHSDDSDADFDYYLDLKRALVEQMSRYVVNRVESILSGARTLDSIAGRTQPYSANIGPPTSSIGDCWTHDDIDSTIRFLGEAYRPLDHVIDSMVNNTVSNIWAQELLPETEEEQ